MLVSAHSCVRMVTIPYSAPVGIPMFTFVCCPRRRLMLSIHFRHPSFRVSEWFGLVHHRVHCADRGSALRLAAIAFTSRSWRSTGSRWRGRSTCMPPGPGRLTEPRNCWHWRLRPVPHAVVSRPTCCSRCAPRFYAFKADFVVADWIARLKPTERMSGPGRAQRADFPTRHPRFRRSALDLKALDKPIDRAMDLEPRTPRNGRLARPGLRPHSIVGPHAARGDAQGKPVASDRSALRQNAAVASRWGCAGASGGRHRAGGLRDVFLRAGRADADHDDMSLLLGGADRTRVIARRRGRRNEQGVVRPCARAPDAPAPRWCGRGSSAARDWSLGYTPRPMSRRARSQTAAIVAADRPSPLNRHRCGPVRLCRLQQSAGQPRDQVRIGRFGASGRPRLDPTSSIQSSEKHPGRDQSIGRRTTPRLRHRRRARASDRPIHAMSNVVTLPAKPGRRSS